MTPLVLIPGMMCDARLFGPLMPLLARRSVLHAACSEHESIGTLAVEILADAPPRFALAGLSMGGIVAMEILRQAPERVDRLALLDTNPRAEDAEVRARREPQIARVRAGGLAAVMRDELKPSYLAAGPMRGEILELCMDMALGLGPDVFERQSRALADRPDQQATLARFDGPALVLMGAEDRLCPHERHALMHALMPQSAFVIVDGAGHLPTLEQPEAVAAAMADWLAA